MKESVGSIPLYNIIFVFLIITFAFLAGTISYSKAFRVNTKIIDAIEKFDGYNIKSSNEINRILLNYGYSHSGGCPTREGAEALSGDEYFGGGHNYCIYRFFEGNGSDLEYKHYGVLTHMYFDIPLPVTGRTFSIPVYSRSDRLYIFPEKWPEYEGEYPNKE